MIIYDDDRFFIVDDESSNDKFLVSTRCQHRGGPLHMASYDGKKECLTCPWHKVPTSIRALRHRALPTARVGDYWIAKLPEGSENSLPRIMPSPGQRLSEKPQVSQAHGS